MERRFFSKEFKLEAVRLMNERVKPITQLSREFGIRRNLLYRWLNEFNNKTKEAFKGPGRPDNLNLSELTRLKQELEAVKEERDILKKAAAYFAKDLK